MHHPASITMNDFGDCYDKLVHMIQSVALRAHGIPKEAVRNMLTCLQIMQFCIRMGIGKSIESFEGTMTNPVMGLGIGSGEGPPAFTVLNILIVNAYKRQGHGATLTSAHMACIFLLAAVMYVDDTDLLHQTRRASVSDEELIEHTQVATIDWCILAQATGGKLKAEKCWVYFMVYEFVGGRKN